MKAWTVFVMGLQLFLAAGAYAGEVDLQWKRAVMLAKQGQTDFAFVDFDFIARRYPESRYAMPAQFAQGEYYFLHNQRPAAIATFEDFTVKYPKSKESLLAMAYLYAAAKDRGDAQAMDKYRKELASSQQTKFIFKDTRSFEFISAFQRRHKVTFSIDKIEVTVNGAPLAEIVF